MHRLCLFALMAVVSADVIFDGPCPTVKPKENFDFSAYQGSWYEIARYPNAGEEGTRGKCTVAAYTVFGDSGKVRNSHVVDGIQSFIDGDLDLVGPAQVRLTYTFGGKSKYSYLTVLDTDYQNYAIGYSCKYFPDGNNHQGNVSICHIRNSMERPPKRRKNSAASQSVFSWIKSRSPTLDAYSRAIVDAYLKESTILDSDKYIANDFSPAACQAGVVRQITEFLKE
ncbi:Bilin-binding protein [Papilio xuthus]|uniref:Bilin-binding protein n=1 Tax=Papilio xuthus TaxID=66420 RepID=A0A194PHH8_PAPXU|nr:Bilin-binding protein [Papilio xuthus]